MAKAIKQQAGGIEAVGDGPVRRVRGVTKNSAEARRKIIDAAILIFGRQGFASTSTEQIAEHAGYGQATVFFHFKTKIGLLKACLEEGLARALGALVTAENSGTLELVRRLDHAFDDHPTAEFFARMNMELGASISVQPIYAAFHAHVRELIQSELMRETGADTKRAHQAAGAILSMMVGVHAEYRLEHVCFDRSDYREMLLRVTALVLSDLAAGQPAPS
jgi:AcrR family transcriptional regulator